ncbi:MAG: PIG-L family deacetylase [Chitinophagaceae bacterium]|nr:PIG-L family deacetylase [Chitinophagaceae bacterium]
MQYNLLVMANNHSRRNFMKQTAVGIGAMSLPALLFAQKGVAINKKKVVCLGAHPDDPESGCGGTLAALRKAGHEVTIIYLTAGEAGIDGVSHDQAATIRKKEASDACKILDAKNIFAGQIDGDTIMNNEWLQKLKQIIANENPDILFAHWPLDAHKDHQVASLIAIQSWLRLGKKFALYFFEVCIGEQSFVFHPTDYVDITNTQEQKRKAVYCHLSQDPPGIYQCGHAAMEDFRGREMGVKSAEAFIRMNGQLPFS